MAKTAPKPAPKQAPKAPRVARTGESKLKGVADGIEEIEDDDSDDDEDDDYDSDDDDSYDDDDDEGDDDDNGDDDSDNDDSVIATSTYPPPNPIPPSSPSSPSTTKILDARAVREAAKQAREDIAVPAPPSKRIKWDKFEPYYKSLTEDMKDVLDMYFYRLEPQIDRKQINPENPKYIDVFPRLPSKDRIIRDHGGGKYLMFVTDHSGPRGKDLCKVELEISEIEHPAIFDIRELVIGPKVNQRFVNKLVAEGKLDPEGNLMPSVGGTRNIQGGGGLDGDLTKMLVSNLIERVDTLSDSERASVRRNAGDDSAVTRAIDLAFQGSVKNLEFLANKLSENNPNNTLEMFVKLFGVINATRGGNGGSDQTTTVLLKMMEMQNQQNQANMQMFQTMMETSRGKGGEGDSELTGVEKTLTILSSMREFVGGGGGGGGRGRNSIWETAIEHLAPVLGQGLDLAKTMMAARSMGMAGGGLGGQVGNSLGGQVINPGPIRRSDLGNQASRPSDAGASEPQRTISSGEMQARRIAAQNQQTGDEMPQTEQPSSAHTQLVGAIRQNGGFIIHALNTGQSGVDMALNLIGLGMRSLYLQIKSQGSEALLAAMRDVPEFWNVAAGQFTEDVVVKFVDEFIHAEELAGEDDDEGEEDIIPPTPKPISKKGGK